jgi:hypothetical protein
VALSDARVGAVVVTGAQIRALATDAEWDVILDHAEVRARIYGVGLGQAWVRASG